jgi:hypothetical protein
MIRYQRCLPRLGQSIRDWFPTSRLQKFLLGYPSGGSNVPTLLRSVTRFTPPSRRIRAEVLSLLLFSPDRLMPRYSSPFLQWKVSTPNFQGLVSATRKRAVIGTQSRCVLREVATFRTRLAQYANCCRKRDLRGNGENASRKISAIGNRSISPLSH